MYKTVLQVPSNQKTLCLFVCLFVGWGVRVFVCLLLRWYSRQENSANSHRGFKYQAGSSQPLSYKQWSNAFDYESHKKGNCDSITILVLVIVKSMIPIHILWLQVLQSNLINRLQKLTFKSVIFARLIIVQ